MQDGNPDSLLAVRFYQREVENNYLTGVEGRPIKYMADYVRIEVPGNMTSIIDTLAHDDHKRRFPIQWAQYMNDKTAESDVQGTLLRDWPLLTSAQASELKHYKFYTVEQVADASDQQIGTIGMLVGMSPFSFRDKARARLAQAKDSAVVEAQADELRRRDQENQSLREELARLSSLIEAKKPGRPKKETEEA